MFRRQIHEKIENQLSVVMEFKSRENIKLIEKGTTMLKGTEVSRKFMKAVNCICVEFKLGCVEEF